MKLISSITFGALLAILSLTQVASAHERLITIMGNFNRNGGNGTGFMPLAAVTCGADGTLYGTTSGGGTASCKCGTVASCRVD